MEAQHDYIALGSDRKKHLKQQTISSLEGALDPQRFVRIHRSYIVNLESVTKIEPYTKDNYVVVLSDGSRLPVSRSGYSRLRDFLKRSAGRVRFVLPKLLATVVLSKHARRRPLRKVIF